MMAEASACLNVDALQPRPEAEDVTMLALDLETILQTLSLPLSSIPDQGSGDVYVLYDADGIKLALWHCSDGGWRFDAETLRRLPAMRRAALERRKKKSADPMGLREGFTDPRAAMRQFVADFANGDFHAAARSLDLTSLSNEQRHQQGPVLA